MLPLSCVLTVVLVLSALTSAAYAFSGFLPGVLPDTIVPVFKSFSPDSNRIPVPAVTESRLDNQLRFLIASQQVFELAA